MKLFAFLFCMFAMLQQVSCLFSNSTGSNFTLTNFVNPTKIVLETQGNKFTVWNNISQIQMYYVNGTKLCEGSFSAPIQRILWPAQYKPIMLTFPGYEFSTLDESTCQIIKKFNVATVTNLTTEPIAYELTFLWKSRAPFIIVSGQFGAYQIDMSPGVFSNTYSTQNGDNSVRYLSTTYSYDFKYIYAVNIDANYGTRSVRFWEAAKLEDRPVKQIILNDPITAMSPSSDKATMISVGLSASTSNTIANRFGNNGSIKSTISRSGVRKAIPIGDGNVVAFFRTGPASVELVRTGDGKTIQNVTYSGSNAFIEADYRNKVLVVLDGTGSVFSYDYNPDEDVQPMPEPVNPENHSQLIWIIVGSVFVGVIVLSIVLMYVFQEKLPEGVRKRLSKCFNRELREERKSLLDSEKDQAIQKRAVRVAQKKQVIWQGKRDLIKEDAIEPEVIEQPEQDGSVKPDSQEDPQQQQHSDQQADQVEEEQAESQQEQGQPAPDEIVPPPMSDAELIEAMSRQAERLRYEDEYRAELQEKQRKQEQQEREYRERQLRQQEEKMQPKHQEEKADFDEERRGLFNHPKAPKSQLKEQAQQEDQIPSMSFFRVPRKGDYENQ